nr:hypothetical protein [Tanacetum cinerariifolium]
MFDPKSMFTFVLLLKGARFGRSSSDQTIEDYAEETTKRGEYNLVNVPSSGPYACLVRGLSNKDNAGSEGSGMESQKDSEVEYVKRVNTKHQKNETEENNNREKVDHKQHDTVIEEENIGDIIAANEPKNDN